MCPGSLEPIFSRGSDSGCEDGCVSTQGESTANPPALAVRRLAKAFGQKVVVKGIDLDVPVGSFYGLVGPNGAGKTTTLSMITGLLRPSDGAISASRSFMRLGAVPL